MIHLFSALLLSSLAFAGIDKTFFVKTIGDKVTGERLMKELTKKECFKHGKTCHAFKKFEHDDQIKGSSRLFHVNITHREGKDRYNLQLFQRDGKTMRRVLNAGNFTPQDFEPNKNRKVSEEEFFQYLLKSTINITFK